MEENSIVKYEGGLIKKISNQIGVTNKLLAVNLRQLNILHLDDHILYHKGILKCVIEEFPNVNVKHIQNGDTALEYVINCFKNNEHIDLIITDINHLGLNGIEFSFAVRDSEKESAKKIPILFITMMDDKSIQEKVKQLPSVMYLLKTSKCEEINCAIENLLSQSSDKIIVV
jgi:DNA-binding NarL/FixJ family response regulator